MLGREGDSIVIVDGGDHSAITTSLPRQALFAKLDRRTPLTIVRAPRGYGKSDLLTSWRDASDTSDHDLVWVPPPQRSSSAAEYLNTILHQCTKSGIVAPGVSGDPFADLVEAFSAATNPVLLVLIRPDLISNPNLEEQLVELVTRCHQLDIVVTLSGLSLFAEPYFLEIDHELIRAEDLLFSSIDTANLLTLSAANPFPGDAHKITTMTGGLPALARSAIKVVKALPAQNDREQLLERNLQIAIDDYTRRAILDNTDIADHRDFLVSCSTARTIDVSTAAHLFTPREPHDRIRERLLALESAGILSRTETGTDGTWELPSAVRLSLMATQPQLGLDSTRQLSSLAHFRLDSGHHASALKYATEGCDWDLAISIIENHWIAMLSESFDTVRRSLQQIPAAAAKKSSVALAGRDLFTMHPGENPKPITSLPRSAEELRVIGASLDARDVLNVGCVHSIMLRVAGNYGPAAETTRRLAQISRRALEINPDDVSPQLPVMRVQWGITFQLSGQFAESTTEMRMAYWGGESQGIDFIARNAAGGVAMNWAIVGEPTLSEGWSRLERKHPNTFGWLHSMVRTPGLIARALTALCTLDLDDAHEAVAALGEPNATEELWAFVLYTHCQYALACREEATAIALLRTAISDNPTKLKPGSFALPLLRSTKIDLALALGDGNLAMALSSDITEPAANPWTLVSVARLYQRAGQNESAIALCHQFDWAAQSYPRPQMEALLIQAVAHSRGDEPRRAAEAWSNACSIADQTGNLRSFSTISLRDVEHLESLAGTGSSALARFLKLAPGETFPNELNLVTLTERERQVLDLIASNASVTEMAHALFISVNTVKTQVRTLYRKLEVHNRREALARARELRLL